MSDMEDELEQRKHDEEVAKSKGTYLEAPEIENGKFIRPVVEAAFQEFWKENQIVGEREEFQREAFGYGWYSALKSKKVYTPDV